MALMDIADIDSLFRAAAHLLRPGGRFVFSLLHPCFDNPRTIQMGELEDRSGTLVKTYSVKVAHYLTTYSQAVLAMPGQPRPHRYFHRPLTDVFRAGFDAGFVIDAFEERSFPADHALESSSEFSSNAVHSVMLLCGVLSNAEFAAVI